MIFSALNARSEETQATGRAVIISLHLLIVEAFSLTIRDGSGYQNGWIFGKIPNGPWSPLELLQKIIRFGTLTRPLSNI